VITTDIIALTAELPKYHSAQRPGVGSPMTVNAPAANSRSTEMSSGNCAVRASRSWAWYA